MVTDFRQDRTPPLSRMIVELSEFTTLDGRKQQSSLNIKNGSYGYNIMLKGGILQTGIGVDEPAFKIASTLETRVLPTLALQGENIVRLHYYRASHLGGSGLIVALGSEGGFYVTSLTEQQEFVPLEGIKATPGSDATFINYYLNSTDTLLIFYSGGMATYDGNTVTPIEGAPIMHSVVMLYDRVFGVSEDKLYFSAPLSPTDFKTESDGGSISFMDEGGALKRIVQMGSELYLFREHSLYRLQVIGRTTDYNLQKVMGLHHPLIPKTLVVARDAMYFCLGLRLYRYDGITMREVQQGLTSLIKDTTHSSATYFDDIYYLSCLLVTEGEKIGDEYDKPIRYNNGVIYFDTLTSTIGVMRGADIVGFFPVLSADCKEIFIIYGNARAHRAGRLTKDGKIYGTHLKKVYRSAKTDLGDKLTLKYLRRAYIDSDHTLVFKISAGGSEELRLVYGGEKYPTPTKSIGQDFEYELRSDGDLNVRSITLIFDKVRRYTRC